MIPIPESFTDWCCAIISMYLIGNASFNSLCLGESFCVLLCTTAYPVIKYLKILQDLVLWSLGRLFGDTLIILVVDSIGRFGARILEWYWKGWKGRCWIKYHLDYRSCTCSSTLKISTGTILLYGWREVNYRKSTLRKSLVCQKKKTIQLSSNRTEDSLQLSSNRIQDSLQLSSNRI